MPELPEVEEVRRTLEPCLLHFAITGVLVYRADFVTPKAAPLKNFVGRRIVRTYRHGKKLFCIANDGQTLLIHLGMSGRVDCVPSSTPLLKHTHVAISLQSLMDIRLVDPRRFGGAWYYATFEAALANEAANLGRDALEIQPADLAHWKKMRGRLKQRLLSQKDVAGLGNIYVDEALWLSHLHPRQLVSRISPQQLRTLVESIHAVLRKSIDSGGTTLRDYRNVSEQPGRFARQLQAYGRGDKPCNRCSAKLKTILVSARTTVFCPACQRSR